MLCSPHYWFRFGALFISVGVILSCPFLQNGRIAQQMIEQRKAHLMAADFRINLGDPTHIIWQMVSYENEIQEAYNRSVVLLQAQQFYLDKWQSGHSANATMDAGQVWRSVEECVPVADRCRVQPKCDPDRRFATATGACNNLEIPLQGASYTPYSRWLGAIFDDGLYTIRKSSLSNNELPPLRIVGNVVSRINTYNPRPRRIPNHGSLLFGQYITHDFGFKDIYQDYTGGNGLRCCSKDFRRPLPAQFSYFGCLAMETPADDPFYSQFGGGCLDYMRSQPVFGNTCKVGPAELSNGVTHYLDHSTIYGSTEAILKSVRTFHGGKLLIENGILAKQKVCVDEFCYFTGDIRGAVYPTLSLWHSIFVRFHNVIASGLSERNGYLWDDERLFQETRRLVTAVYQNIVYNEWLPLYLGEATCLKRNLTSGRNSAHSGWYAPEADASNLNEFGNAAFRVFHANTPVNINMYDEKYRLNETLPLDRSIHGAGILERQYYGVMRGFFKDPIHIGSYPDHIRNTVFSEGNKNHIGLDLMSVDTMRGRDHGLRPYHEYLALCMPGKVVTCWSDLNGIFSRQSIKALSELYESVTDIDLLIGINLEEKRGRLAGPVATFIMEEQFYRSKYGDRFFYSLVDNAYPFSVDQLHQINRMGFANVLCTSSEIQFVPKHIFDVIGPRNPLISCPKFLINLDLWTE